MNPVAALALVCVSDEHLLLSVTCLLPATMQVLPVGFAHMVCEYYVGDVTTDSLQLRLEAQLSQKKTCTFSYIHGNRDHSDDTDSSSSDSGSDGNSESTDCGTLTTASPLMPRQLLNLNFMYRRAGVYECFGVLCGFRLCTGVSVGLW